MIRKKVKLFDTLIYSGYILIVGFLFLVFDSVRLNGSDLERPKWANALAMARSEGRLSVVSLLTNPICLKSTWEFPELPELHPTVLTWKDKPLVDLLTDKSPNGTNSISIDEMLDLRQIHTGEEPETITYNVKLAFDAMEKLNHGTLQLLLDCPPGSDYYFQPKAQDCSRAKNGDCLLSWDTVYEKPGQHALQAFLTLVGPEVHAQALIRGPVVPFYSSNLCQFFPIMSPFDSNGLSLYAQLVESNAVFDIDIKCRSGEFLKSLNGTTSNGVIDMLWNLHDEGGHVVTNEFITTFYHLKLTKSGRSQTLKEFHRKLPSLAIKKQ